VFRREPQSDRLLALDIIDRWLDDEYRVKKIRVGFDITDVRQNDGFAIAFLANRRIQSPRRRS
jgi:hypothetical protein